MTIAETATRTVTRGEARRVQPSKGEPGAIVELSGVTRRYGRLVALQKVDLSITPGELVFVIGPSEAGKTTLLKLIHGDLRPNRGRVRVIGHRLERRWRRRLPRLRRQVAAVFQDHRLLPNMTARGNVAFALQVADLGMPHAEVRARAQERLDQVGLGARPGAWPRELSGGQQRRLAIARALGHDPVVVLADEPTANLDRANAERVLDLLEGRCRTGATVIIATHDVDLALARPHRVIELNRGKIVSDRPAAVAPPGAAALARRAALAEQAEAERRPSLLARGARALLGYMPLPPAAPRPRVPLKARAESVAQAVLGYSPPPAWDGNGAWHPPAQLANGHHTNGVTAPVQTVIPLEDPDGGGAWRPPAQLAEARAAAAAPAIANGHGNGNGHHPEAGSLRRLSRLVLGYAPPPVPAVPLPRRRARDAVGRVFQVILGYTPPPALARKPARPPRRWPWTPAVNLWRLAFAGAIASWARNLGTAAPALGSITLLLLLGGTLSVSGIALNTLLSAQASEASILHVYLSDSAGTDQIDQARQALSATAHVRSVRFIDKDQALAQAQKRPGLTDLANLSDTNPFPASLEVRVDKPADVAGVAKVAASEPGVDTTHPTSYDQGTYDRLRQFVTGALVVAAGFGFVILMVTYAISSNSIRAAVLVRRDELMTMQLVGASRWLLRTRLGVEGGLTGAGAGLIAAALVVGICAGAYFGARRLFVQVLPGVNVPGVAWVCAGVVAVGILLGVVSALFAFRRLKA